MIPDAGQIAAALAGAFRLLRFDRAGFGYFDASIDGLWRSFFCAVLVLPFYALMVGMRMDDADLANPFLRIVAVEGIAYVIGWTAFPLVMAFLTDSFDRAAQYPGYIVAYNWCAAPQVALTLAAALIGAADILPDPMQTGLQIGVMLYLMAVQWFVARRALDVNRGTAAGVVVVDFLLSLAISEVAAALLAQPAGV